MPVYSKTGTMTAEGAAAVKRVLSVCVETMKTGNFDLSKDIHE